MWLDVNQRVQLIHFGPSGLVVPWKVDIRHVAEELPPEPGGYTVGRILADAMSRFDIEECGEDPWTVADDDSCGLEAAWASLKDESGNLRTDDFETIMDPIVYIYRFALHPDFVEWRLAVMDAFCRLFGSDAVILAQYRTTHYSDTEFKTLGFERLPPRVAPHTRPADAEIDVDFMVRNNARASLKLTDYPKDWPEHPTRRHEEWVEKQGPWEGLG